MSEQQMEPAAPAQSAEHNPYTFRCTFCRKTIGRPLSKKDLGVSEDEEFQVGKLYPYTRCYCGMGKFVSCELTDLAPDEVQGRMSQIMAH